MKGRRHRITMGYMAGQPWYSQPRSTLWEITPGKYLRRRGNRWVTAKLPSRMILRQITKRARHRGQFHVSPSTARFLRKQWARKLRRLVG